MKYGPVAIAQKFTVFQIQAHQVFHLKQVGYKSRTDFEVSLDLLFFSLKFKDFPVNSTDLIWTNKKIF